MNLKKWIKQNLLTVKNTVNTAKIKRNGEWLDKHNFSHYKNEIINETSFLDNNSSLSQRIYHIINDIWEKPLCKNCNKEVNFITFTKGYSTYCNECGLKISGNTDNSNKTKKTNTSNKINDILIINEFYSKNRCIELIKLYMSETHNWYSLKIIKNLKLLASINHYTNFISTNDISKISDFNFSEKIYCLLNGISNIPICPVCNKNKKKFINFEKGYQQTCSYKCGVILGTELTRQNTETKVLKNLKKYNCELLSEYHYNTSTCVKCNICGEIFTYNFPYGSGIYRNICPHCSLKIKSKNEMKIFKFLSKYNENIIHNYREYDNGNSNPLSFSELDIYIPDKKLAIEFNGLYWHNEEKGRDKQYHLHKTKLCEDKGIQLIHIFEDEWLTKKEIVKSVLLSKLGIYNERIYARKCIVKEVDKNEKKQFLCNYHLQGNSQSNVNLGLFYENDLVSIMTFGKRKITGGKVKLELIRFCNKLNTQIIGGASKLFKYFLNNYWHNEEIITYADRRWSNGLFYEKIGFKLDHISQPNYFYFKNVKQRYNRISFQKHKLKDKLPIFNNDLTEYENMLNNGYYRIWDCGNYVYTYIK